MPLEMLDGKTGPRLIARLPIDEGALAIVTLEDDHQVILSYEGGRANGFPALTPLIESLPSEAALAILRKRADLRSWISWAESRLVQAESSLSNVAVICIDSALIVTLQRTVIDLERAMLRPTKLAIETLPVCPRIMPGEMMIVKLPCTYGDVATVHVGRVRRIRILN